MTSLTKDVVRALAATKGRAGPIVTLYLDVDGRRYVRPKDYEAELDRLLRGAMDHPQAEAAAPDLDRVSTYVRSGFDRSHTRGLAIVSGKADDLWEVFELPVPVRSQLVINATPHVRKLEAVVDNHERFALLLADRQHARLFLFDMGELIDRTEVFDQLPRHEDDKGDWDKDHVRDHAAEVAHHHLKRAAASAFEVFQGAGFDHLILGGPEELLNDLERELHSYLRERVVARVKLAINASEATIRDVALDAGRQIERQREAASVAKLRDAIGSNNGGVAGLQVVLDALGERRVDMLLVSEGFEREGWRCDGCSHLAAVGSACSVCGGKMVLVDDIVEEAIEAALGQSCRVEIVVDNADLDVLGQIGALLRY